MASALLTITDLAANAVVDFLDGAADQGSQNLRFIEAPRGAQVTWALEGITPAAELEIFSGARTIQERSGIDGGGTAGVMPNLQQKAQQFLAARGEILKFRVRETGGVATLDLVLFISVDPL